MKPTVDIASAVSFVTDVALRLRSCPRTARQLDAPEPAPDWDLLQQPKSDFEFDQRIAW